MLYRNIGRNILNDDFGGMVRIAEKRVSFGSLCAKPQCRCWRPAEVSNRSEMADAEPISLPVSQSFSAS
jgi:hypothetical protein